MTGFKTNYAAGGTGDTSFGKTAQVTSASTAATLATLKSGLSSGLSFVLTDQNNAIVTSDGNNNFITEAGSVFAYSSIAYIVSIASNGIVSVLTNNLSHFSVSYTGGQFYLSDQNKYIRSNGTQWVTNCQAKKYDVAGRGMFGSIGAAGFTAAGAAYTYMHEVAIPQDFDWVRVHLVNGNTSTNTIVGAKVAVATALADGGTGLTWSSLTFSDAATAQPLPPASSTTPTTYAIPVANVTIGANTTVQAVNMGQWSDWIKLPSSARSDSVSGGILQVRVALPTGSYVTSLSGSLEIATFDAAAGNLTWRNALTAGDLVTTTSTAMTAVNTSGWMAIDAVEVIPRTSVSHILEVGDSISRGQGWVSQSNGSVSPGHLAALSYTGSVSYTNKAASGRKQASYIIEARNMLASSFYSAVIIPVWTPNDNDSTTTIGADWPSLLAFIAYAKSRGTKVILRSAIPDYALSAAQDATRLSLNTKAKNLAKTDPDVFYLDTDTIISDQASPARQLTTYSTGNDGRHPNAAGITAESAAYKAIFSILL